MLMMLMFGVDGVVSGDAPERCEPLGGRQRPRGRGRHPAVAVLRAQDRHLGTARPPCDRPRRARGKTVTAVALWALECTYLVFSHCFFFSLFYQNKRKSQAQATASEACSFIPHAHCAAAVYLFTGTYINRINSCETENTSIVLVPRFFVSVRCCCLRL